MHAKQADRWIAGIALLALGVGSLMVLLPFLTAIIWAGILTYSGWPLLSWIERRVGGHRVLATMLLTALIILLVLAPLLIVISNLTNNSDEIRAFLGNFKDGALPLPPEWVKGIPIIGVKIETFWLHALQDRSWLLTQLQSLQVPTGRFILTAIKVLGTGILELALSIFIAFFMFCNGEHLAARLQAVFQRLAGPQGVRLTILAGNTVSGVVYGVMGTAVIQGVLTGLGLWIAGIPGAALLGLLTFFISIVPIGPPVVWIPATIWLYFHGGIGWAIFMLIWGAIIVSSVDNFLKPALISRGARMPFVLVLMGVMGGIFAFGFIGIFLGPTLLAVVYRLIQEWTRDQDHSLVSEHITPIIKSAIDETPPPKS